MQMSSKILNAPSLLRRFEVPGEEVCNCKVCKQSVKGSVQLQSVQAVAGLSSLFHLDGETVTAPGDTTDISWVGLAPTFLAVHRQSNATCTNISKRSPVTTSE